LAFADPETVLRWTAAGLRDARGAAAAELLVADSWLVDGGTVRAADAHWARFGASCRGHGLGAAELARFRAAATAAVPATGRWFPRVELDARGLALRIRPAPPPAAGGARVLVAAPGDPRRCPRRKDPDLPLLLTLRARAQAAGADELLLCDDAGALREGALSSLLWWEDGTLWTTPDEHTLPGITRALLLDAAHRHGVDVRVRSPLPQELAGREVWLTSALHGIRVVGGWVQPPQAAGPPERAATWRCELAGRSATLPRWGPRPTTPSPASTTGSCRRRC
jgi:branched-subunit amino acid aminotransferase/4-amino-4-deoxychorismate lyase